MAKGDYPFTCAIVTQKAQGRVILRTGAKGLGRLLGKWPLKPDGIVQARRLSRKYAEKHSGDPKWMVRKLIELDEEESKEYDRRMERRDGHDHEAKKEEARVGSIAGHVKCSFCSRKGLKHLWTTAQVTCLRCPRCGLEFKFDVGLFIAYHLDKALERVDV